MMYHNKLSLAIIFEKLKICDLFQGHACVMCEFPCQESKSLCKNKKQQNIIPYMDSIIILEE